MADLFSLEEAELVQAFQERFGEPPAIRDTKLLRLVLGEADHDTEPQRRCA